jgi:hypothetical protein
LPMSVGLSCACLRKFKLNHYPLSAILDTERLLCEFDHFGTSFMNSAMCSWRHRATGAHLKRSAVTTQMLKRLRCLRSRGAAKMPIKNKIHQRRNATRC